MQMTLKSAETVASIEDLLTEILLRLPVKSLLNFKSVSKQWHSVITNPNFCHLRSCWKTKPPAIGLFIHSGDFSFNESLTTFHFLSRGPGEWKYYVCIPTTKHTFRIPQLDETIVKGMGLAFDPAKSPHYHVVCVHECTKNGDLLFRIHIYSSKTGSWKICGNPFSSPLISAPAVHWNWTKRFIYYFGESCDHLHFIVACQYEIRFDVYEMKRDYSEWFVKYKVDLSQVVAAYPEMIRDYNLSLLIFN
ncbi:hypothetical protein RD792_005204 [Penstemon davidsonii]|uniref:F-box domain-containing protein n=1 Tax=Penstemon davidsonii TaxID=160366 RepID=A0ABR0DJH5_9LAMI|nr:hypothetical protein RD792_005204 [Penstemon davidsonii]